jgi:hypothetical protein
VGNGEAREEKSGLIGQIKFQLAQLLPSLLNPELDNI